MAKRAHKGFQVTITTGMFVVIGFQFAENFSGLAAGISVLVNLMWLWEDDISHWFFPD